MLDHDCLDKIHLITLIDSTKVSEGEDTLHVLVGVGK